MSRLVPPKPARRSKTGGGPRAVTRVRHPQSSKEGIIIFMGDVQGGKSSTLNFLFGDPARPLSPTSGGGTQNILEFRSIHPIDNLRLIDVPGLGASPDESGLARDAQIMGTFKKVLDTDVELSRCIPHLLFLVTRFDAPEAEFGHPDSAFVRTLKAIHLLKARLIDPYNSNVIVVLTHFMGGKRRYRLVPQPLLDRTKQLVKDHLQLNYDPLLVLAENRAVELNLSQVGSNFRLTNGDSYPQNLVEAILAATNGSKSLVGSSYFFNVLKTCHNIRFHPEPRVIPMVDPDRRRFQKFFKALALTLEGSTV